MREPGAMAAPDGVGGGTKLPKPDRGASRRRREAGLRLAHAVLAHLRLAIAVIDGESRLLFWNEQAAGLFGVAPAMAEDKPVLAEVLAGVADLTRQQRDRIVAFAATHVAGGDRVEPEGWLRVTLGRDRRIMIEVQGIGAGHWMLVIDDGTMGLATGRMGSAKAGDAWLDALTGLGNRRHFNQVLRALVDDAEEGARHSVLVIDLDRFAPVNDALGHEVGDSVLCLVAQRLRRITREEDVLVRLGGDTFVILLAGAERAEALATRVVDTVSRPFQVGGQVAHVGASVGIACYPEHGRREDDLMRHAERALRGAKRAGGGGWRVFDSGMAAEEDARLVPETSLPKVVSPGEASPSRHRSG
ncbi:MAG TPA: diguanylate cyclase [Rhodopila sp.]|nr:diguanylate cyclase [Rhodopila sp.]